nr:MAG TPA: hypothetical protein [Caudoviricetes sp.]
MAKVKGVFQILLSVCRKNSKFRITGFRVFDF